MNHDSPRIGVLGTDGGVSFASMGFDNALQAVGLNIGNLLFQYAVWNDIKNPKCAFYLGSDISFYKRNIDILVIPAANQINPAADH